MAADYSMKRRKCPSYRGRNKGKKVYPSAGVPGRCKHIKDIRISTSRSDLWRQLIGIGQHFRSCVRGWVEVGERQMAWTRQRQTAGPAQVCTPERRTMTDNDEGGLDDPPHALIG
jgi:hypothetical protein